MSPSSGEPSTSASLRAKGGDPAGAACRRARRVHSNIVNDASMQLPQEFHAGQNIAAAAILLQALTESEDPVQRDLHHQFRHLVELIAIQQAESSSLHHRQAASCPAGDAQPQHWEFSTVQQAPPAPLDVVDDAPAPAPAPAPLPPRPLVHSCIGPGTACGA